MKEYGNSVLIPSNLTPPPPQIAPNPFGPMRAGTKYGNKGQYYSGGSISINAISGNVNGFDYYNINNTWCQQEYNSPIGNPLCVMILPKRTVPWRQQGWGIGSYDTAVSSGMTSQVYFDAVILTYREKGNTNTQRRWYWYDNKKGEHITYSGKGIMVRPNEDPKVHDVFGADSNPSVYDNISNTYGSLNSLLRGLDVEVNISMDGVTVENARLYDQQISIVMHQLANSLSAKYKNFNTVMDKVSFCTYIDSYPITSGWGISNQFSTTLPLFNYTDLENIYLYFAGEDPDYINKPDIELSKISLATDWTVYVKGGRAPDIAITMESPELEQFLADSSKNTGGLNKSDFECVYKWWSARDEFVADGLPRVITKTVYQNYGETYRTSWTDIAEASPVISIPDIGATSSDLTVPISMYIRQKQDIKKFSAECEAGIGFYGSPSIPEFSQQINYAIVTGIADGSTIQIIYDKLPDDDEYVDPDDEIEDTPTNVFDMTSILTTTYKISVDEMKKFAEYLWGASFIDNIKLVNNNPMENIVSVKMFPIDIPSGEVKQIVLGNIKFPAIGNVVEQTQVFSVGKVTYNGVYGSFLDSAPYTKITLFCPFCGFMELDPTIVTGKEMEIFYSVDAILGTCKALVYLDGGYFSCMDGTIAVDIPLTGNNRAQQELKFLTGAIDNAVTLAQTAVNMKAGAMMGAGGASMGAGVSEMAKANGAARVSGSMPSVSAMVDNALPVFHTHTVGTYSPANAWHETNKIYMIVEYPVSQYPDSYAHDYGYPAMITRTLSTMRGFVQTTDNVDMKYFKCTDQEKEMIKELLISGVYI